MGFCEPENNKNSPQKTTNEYVLNFAFFSFIGFVVFQAVFALIAKSESMLADSEAMSVDALTYLFNLVAERIKNAPYSDKELAMTSELREYHREIRRLYLELIPPAISVTTLIVVTAMTLKDAIATLRQDEDGDAEDVSVTIMLIFSGANLLLDVVNVTCFARVNSAFGLEIVRRDSVVIQESIRTRDWGPELYGIIASERTGLLSSRSQDSYGYTSKQQNQEYTEFSNDGMINLNMCSAWTHVCADTLRSIAVLIAAAIACLVPAVPPAMADAVAAIAVSIIIFVSLFPLVQRLVVTALQIHHLHRYPPDSLSAQTPIL